jgi:prepilin-type N-terminal cleavage/methylation domain-containing protein
MTQFRHGPGHGFTLVETLLALAVLALLTSLLLPAAEKAAEAADRARCGDNLKQVGIATHNIHDTYGRMPPLAGFFPAKGSTGTIFFYLLPFLEQQELYQSAGDGSGQYSVWNNSVYGKPLKLFVCPADHSLPEGEVFDGWLATGNYAANFLVFGDVQQQTMQGRARLPASFPDGTSNTIMFTERYRVCGGEACAWGYAGTYFWTPAFAYYSQARFQSAPTQGQCDAGRAQSAHAGVINVCMGDAAVRSVADTVSPATWWAASTPAGGEVLGEDW